MRTVKVPLVLSVLSVGFFIAFSQGFSLNKNNGAQYATSGHTSQHFDLLSWGASDRSHFLGHDHDGRDVPSSSDSADVGNNEIFIMNNEATHSRRRRQVSIPMPQRSSQQVIQIQTSSPTDFQRLNLCLPYMNTNAMCRQMFLGLVNTNKPNNLINANNYNYNNHGQSQGQFVQVPPLPQQQSQTPSFSVPLPASISNQPGLLPVAVQSPSPTANQNLALLNYYYQQQQPQAPISSGIFQGPLPAERQRHKVYEKIHVKYPYPYPPGPPSTSGPDPAIPDGAEPSGDNSSSSPAPVQEGQDQGQGEGQESPPAPIAVDGTDEPVGVTSIADPVTTDVPSAGSSDSVSETTTQEVQETQAVSEKIMQQEQDPESPGAPNIPDSPGQEQGQGQPGQLEVSTSTTTMYPMYPMYPEEGQGQGQDQMQDPAQSESAPAPPQQSDTEHLNMLKRLAQSKEEIRGLQRELEQAHEQIASYEQETQSVKDQFIRSEDANLKLRGRVLQLENQNQHLQEQNGQLQQLNSEHKQQINGYKISVKELREKMDTAHSENVLLNREVIKHRRELEEILLRVRKMDEESEMCRKQVKLYQLKVNYILGRQKEQEGETKGQGQGQSRPQSHPPPPQIQFDDAEPQLHQDPPPPAPQEEAKEPEKTVQAQAGVSEVTDDELDPELMRMDAEIAELQRNADEVAAAIKKLALAPRQEISSPPGVIPASAIPASPVPEIEQQPGGSEAVAASQVQEEVAAPENVKVEVKRENQFPGEAVQIPQRTSQQKPNVPAIPASAVVAGGDAKWEKPEGFKK